jgi:hypothetical protein
VIRSESLSPYSGTQYGAQLLGNGYTHVITLYLPSAANGNTWISDQYEARILEAVKRWQPELVVSAEIDLDNFPTLREALGPKLRTVKPLGILDIARSSFERLHKFLVTTGISDRKFYLLYRPEYGPLYDDVARDSGFKSLEPIAVSTLGELKSALASIPRNDNVAIINALTHVEDIEFDYAVLGPKVANMIRRTGLLDLSVIDSAPGAVSVRHSAAQINFESSTITAGNVVLCVDPKRLRALGLKEVYVVGFKDIDSITQ